MIKVKNIFNKYVKKFLHLPIRQRLLIGFFVKWIVWSVVELLTKRFLLFEEWTWSYVLFYGGMMALLLTIPFNWKMLRPSSKGAKITPVRIPDLYDTIIERFYTLQSLTLSLSYRLLIFEEQNNFLYTKRNENENKPDHDI